MTPKLEKIDLNKRQFRTNECIHPDINTHSSYLAKIEGRWYAGKFSRQHYGLNFEAIYDAGFQLDYDGWGSYIK